MFALTGCAAPQNQTAAFRLTSQPAATAKGDYWMSQPAAEQVASDDFDALWNAARNVAKSMTFRIERSDMRDGVLTTAPNISQQFFEIWRGDTVTLETAAESSLATIRRTIRVDFARLDDGRWSAAPKVLVERYAFIERRITSVIRYSELFGRPDPRRQAAGGFAGGLDRDLGVPESYWYAIGRDPELEKKIAERMEGELRSLARR